MPKIHIIEHHFCFHCPGCEYLHSFTNGWTFNGDFDNPTVSPSILVFKDDPARRCHFHIENGKIKFLPDCFHRLAGQTADLPEWES